MSWFLIQTEKAYNLGMANTFAIANNDKNFKTNKIELAKLLKSKGYTVTTLTSTASQQKLKSRGKRRNKVEQFRPKKWYVTLQAGQVLTEENVAELSATNEAKEA